MWSQPIPYPLGYEIDLEAELANTRYAQALQAVRVEDVISTALDALAEMEPTKGHPLYQLARDVLRFGSCRRSGRRFHAGELLVSRLEDVMDEAVERLVCEYMQQEYRADLALDAE